MAQDKNEPQIDSLYDFLKVPPKEKEIETKQYPGVKLKFPA